MQLNIALNPLLCRQLINFMARRRVAPAGAPDSLGPRGMGKTAVNLSSKQPEVTTEQLAGCQIKLAPAACPPSLPHDVALPAPAGSGGLPVSGAEALFGPARRASVEAGATAALTGNMGTSGGTVRVRNNVFGSWARQSALASKVRGRRGLQKKEQKEEGQRACGAPRSVPACAAAFHVSPLVQTLCLSTPSFDAPP